MPSGQHPPRNHGSPGFTWVEVMLSTVILAILVVMFATMTSQTSTLWKRTTGKIEQFREARGAFELITSRLSQATLNTYWDYDNPTTPTRFERRSELRFISGPVLSVLPSGTSGGTRLTHAIFFQAPLGVTATDDSGKKRYQGFPNLLCTCGYYLEFNDDSNLRPPFITNSVTPPKYRHRLMQFLPPAESDIIYSLTSGYPKAATYSNNGWYVPQVNQANSPYSRPIAENIVALIITPRLSQEDEQSISKTNSDESPLAPSYLYDSSPVLAGGGDARYADARLDPVCQLPPVVQVTMVAIDEGTAIRLGMTSTSANVFGVSGKFTKSADYGKDLLVSRAGDSLEANLINKVANYRIFNTTVTIRGSKWSRQQTQ